MCARVVHMMCATIRIRTCPHACRTCDVYFLCMAVRRSCAARALCACPLFVSMRRACAVNVSCAMPVPCPYPCAIHLLVSFACLCCVWRAERAGLSVCLCWWCSDTGSSGLLTNRDTAATCYGMVAQLTQVTGTPKMLRSLLSTSASPAPDSGCAVVLL